MSLNINYNGKNEILIQGSKDDYGIIIGYLLDIRDNATISLASSIDNEYYLISIDNIHFCYDTHKHLLSFYVKDKDLYIEGNEKLLKKLADNIIEPLCVADMDFHIDLFYYNGNDLIDNNNILITFELK